MSAVGHPVPTCLNAVPARANGVLCNGWPSGNDLPPVRNQVSPPRDALSGHGYQVPAASDQVPAYSDGMRPDRGGYGVSACGYQLQRLTGCDGVPTGSDPMPADTNRLQQCNGWSGGDSVPDLSDQVSDA